jgi:NitT/TauT family transport system permease protein
VSRRPDLSIGLGLAPWALIAAILLVWQGACRILHTPVYLLPAPSDIAAALGEGWPGLLNAAINTLVVSLEAWMVALLIATPMAMLTALSPAIERALAPIAATLQVTPVVAIAPLFVIWAGLEHPDRAIMVLAAIVAFFPIFSGAVAGLASADKDLERLFDLYGAGRLQRLIRLRLPSAIPFWLEGAKVAVGLAIVGAVVAEFVAGSGGSQGLAWRILESSHQLRTADMFAALVVLALLGTGLNALVRGAERRLLKAWRGR